MTSEDLDGVAPATGDHAPAETSHEISDADRAANPFGAARDERGRFAQKQDEQPKADTQGDQPAGEQPADGQQRQSGTVPHQALAAARGKQREAESEAVALRRELAELRGMMTGIQRQQAPQPAPEPQQQPEFWADPVAATDYRLKGAIDPVTQSLEGMKIEYSKRFATLQHGEEAVTSAIDALGSLRQSSPAEFQHLEAQASRSMDPVGVVVQWHKQQRALAEVGNDPDAWRTKERDRIRQELMAEMGGSSPEPDPAPAAQAPRLPTSFAAPRSGGPRGATGFGGARPLSEIMPRG